MPNILSQPNPLKVNFQAMRSLELRREHRQAHSFGGAGFNGASLTRNRVDLPFFLPPKRGHAINVGLPAAEDVSLPPKYTSDLLLQLYFSHIHSILPILDQTAFRSKFNAVYSLGICPDAPFLSVMLSVFAATSRLLPGAATSSSAAEYFEQAQITHYRAMRGAAQIENIQCLALMSLYLGGINDMPQSWLNAGQAVRIAQDLGLHVNFCSFSFRARSDISLKAFTSPTRTRLT